MTHVEQIKMWLGEDKKVREIAHQEINDLCQNKKQWTMCIPVHKSDSDVRLQNAIDSSEFKDAIIKKLVDGLDQITEPPDFAIEGNEATIALRMNLIAHKLVSEVAEMVVKK